MKLLFINFVKKKKVKRLFGNSCFNQVWLSLFNKPIKDVKQELIKLVKAAGFSSSTTCNNWEGNKTSQSLSFQEMALLKAVLAAGLYDNVGKIIYTKSVDVTEKLACIVETAQGKAQVHPSSVNRDLQTHGWLLYQEKVKGSSLKFQLSRQDAQARIVFSLQTEPLIFIHI